MIDCQPPRIIFTRQIKKEEADNENRLSEGKDFSKGEGRVYWCSKENGYALYGEKVAKRDMRAKK
jgi:hypothetical protein